MRIAGMVGSFYVASGCSNMLNECDPLKADYKLAIFLYFMNFAGDVVDGYAGKNDDH
jgi:hypothetical protein